MPKSWFKDLPPDESQDNPQVIIRASAPDQFSGLKGHAYVAARGLNAHVTRVQTSAHTGTLKQTGEQS